MAARIVRSVLVLIISAVALEWGLSSPFRFRGASFPLFGIGIMLFGIFGLYTIYRDWRYCDRPAGFQKNDRELCVTELALVPLLPFDGMDTSSNSVGPAIVEMPVKF